MMKISMLLPDDLQGSHRDAVEWRYGMQHLIFLSRILARSCYDHRSFIFALI